MVEKVISGTSGPSIPTSSVDSQVEAPSQDIVSSPDTNPTRRKRRSFSIPGRLLSRAMLPIMTLLSMAGGSAVSAQLQPNYLKPDQASSSQLTDNNIMPSEQAPKVEIQKISQYEPYALHFLGDQGLIGAIKRQDNGRDYLIRGSLSVTGTLDLETVGELGFSPIAIAGSETNPNLVAVIGGDPIGRIGKIIAYSTDGGKTLATIDLTSGNIRGSVFTGQFADNGMLYVPKSVHTRGIDTDELKMLKINPVTKQVVELSMSGDGATEPIISMTRPRLLSDGSYGVYGATTLLRGFAKGNILPNGVTTEVIGAPRSFGGYARIQEEYYQGKHRLFITSYEKVLEYIDGIKTGNEYAPNILVGHTGIGVTSFTINKNTNELIMGIEANVADNKVQQWIQAARMDRPSETRILSTSSTSPNSPLNSEGSSDDSFTSMKVLQKGSNSGLVFGLRNTYNPNDAGINIYRDGQLEKVSVAVKGQRWIVSLPAVLNSFSN